MAKLPLYLPARRINSAKSARVWHGFIGRKIGAAVISMAHVVGLRRRAEDVALLTRGYIKESGSRIEAGGHPVGRAQRPWANRSTLWRRRALVVGNGTALRIFAVAPSDLAI